MELSLPIQNPNTLSSPKTFSSTKQPLIHWVPPKSLGSKPIMGGRIRCGKNTSLMMDLKRELEEIEKEGREMKKCKEEATLVELLECLEREAIMGDDEGREPTDYNRRAQIFDKSSKVFQALKELRGTGDVTTTEV